MKKFLFVFIISGIGALVIAGYWANDTYQFIKQSISQKGTVIALSSSKSEGNELFHPVVKFITLNNQTIVFRSGMGSNPSAYHVGEIVEVIYLPDAPHEAKINGFFTLWLGPLGFTLLGIMALLSSLVPLVTTQMRKRLKNTGDRILAEFHSIQHIRSIKLNGSSPYKIICHWQDPLEPTKIHVFHSGYIRFYPGNFINHNQIPVYIDKENPKKYYVDISFLP